MDLTPNHRRHIYAGIALGVLGISNNALAADQELLDILLANGAITEEQYENLIGRDTVSSEEILTNTNSASETNGSSADFIVRQLEEQLPVKATQESSGFRLETRDGNWRTDLQWRAQTRFTTPYRSDPRQISSYNSEQNNFEARRLRMKIGGHGFQPWLRYYFEVDLQPSRDYDDSSSSSSARVIDWRLDIAKWDWGGIRVGQWKVDLNRERVDSSGRQQFVERSIANRVFTMDRQVGIQLRGHLFQDTPADMRYYAGVFNGEGRSVNNADDNLMYMGRLQWNFLGRDLSWRQTDVEYTEKPAGSFASLDLQIPVPAPAGPLQDAEIWTVSQNQPPLIQTSMKSIRLCKNLLSNTGGFLHSRKFTGSGLRTRLREQLTS